MSETNKPGIWLSIAGGAIGGLVASYAMNQYQALISAALKEEEDSDSSGGDDATVKAAKTIAKDVFGAELREDQKAWAGPLVHYSLGTTLGAVYGAAAWKFPAVEAGAGTAFGAVVWAGADEIAVPSFGLSQKPSETPLSSHANALAAHLVFGLVTSLSRSLFLKGMA